MSTIYRRVFDRSPHAYLVVSAGPDFEILAVNERYLGATGTTRKGILGRKLFEVFPDNPTDFSVSGVSDLRTSLEGAVRDRRPDVMGVQKYDIPDGHGGFETRYWSPVNTPITNAAGDVEFIIHHVEDVTEFVLHRENGNGGKEDSARPVVARADRMEAEVLRRAEEVKQANRQIKAVVEELEVRKAELTQANARLAELDRAKSEFFTNASHELRTPLTLILGPIEELLRDDAVRPEQRKGLEVARRHAQRLARQIDAVLEFSRLEGAPPRTPAEPIDLAALTIDLASHFRSACDSAGLSLVVDCPALPGLVAVDADAWEKIVLNLISNAVKFTEAGSVEVRLRALEGAIELTVRDTGVGIPEDELPRIFERFHRVKAQRRRAIEGSGIGLALVQELARFQGGSVQVESAVGQGSAFKVVLPVTEFVAAKGSRMAVAAGRARPRAFAEEAGRETPSPHAIVEPVPTGRSARPLVLVVEDNADMRDYLVRLLGGAGYNTRAVADGEEVLAACRETTPALVLSDVMMPRLDGLELTRRLRADERTLAVPVVLLSARAGEAARVEGFEAGADEYLQKPFAAAELIARIQAAERLAEARGKLAKRDSHFATIVATAMDGIISIDERQRIVLFNPAAERMFGWPAAEALGRPLIDFIPARYRAAHQDHVRGFAKLGASARTRGQFGRIMALRADGSEFPIEASISRTQQDRSMIFTVMHRDVSERVALEQELDRKRREAETAARVKAEFLANMSHEIRTPLTAIIGYSGLLEDRTDLPASARRYVGRIGTGGQVLLSVVNDILDFSKMEAGQVELSPQPFDPRAFLDETLDLVREQARGKGLRLQLNVSDAVPALIVADADRLRQVLLYLLNNAVKFIPAGSIAVEVGYGIGTLDVSITDSGIGIPPERLERLFQRFSQVDGTTARLFGGTGLGLAICKGLVELTGGTIGVVSEEGRGSTFRFSIDAPAADPKAARQRGGETAPDLASKRILRVDDVEANRELVVALLRPLGVEVAEASTGAEAVELATRQPFDLILMDVQLPGMDGLAATRSIRTTAGPNRTTPILALTADVMPEEVRAARESGMDGHTGKPIVPRALLTSIAELIAPPPRPETP